MEAYNSYTAIESPSICHCLWPSLLADIVYIIQSEFANETNFQSNVIPNTSYVVVSSSLLCHTDNPPASGAKGSSSQVDSAVAVPEDTVDRNSMVMTRKTELRSVKLLRRDDLVCDYQQGTSGTDTFAGLLL